MHPHHSMSSPKTPLRRLCGARRGAEREPGFQRPEGGLCGGVYVFFPQPPFSSVFFFLLYGEEKKRENKYLG